MKPAVFLDRDGTLIEERGYLDRLELIEPFPWTPDALRRLRSAGYALVLVTNVQTGASRSLTTDGAGNFTAPSLVPGLYSLTVEAKGFTKQIRSGGRLPVSETIHGPH